MSDNKNNQLDAQKIEELKRAVIDPIIRERRAKSLLDQFMEDNGKKTPEFYAKRFEEVIENNIPIKDGEGIFKLKDGDIFAQAYQKTDPKTYELPPYWFVSPDGIVISVYGETPKILKPQKRGNYLAYDYKKNGKSGRVGVYALIGLVYNYPCVGNAEQLLNEQSIHAIKLISDPSGVNFHHTHDRNNDRKGQFLPTNIHKEITELNKNGIPDPSEVENFLRKMPSDQNERMYLWTPKGMVDDGEIAKKECMNILEAIKKLGWSFTNDFMPEEQ